MANSIFDFNGKISKVRNADLMAMILNRTDFKFAGITYKLIKANNIFYGPFQLTVESRKSAFAVEPAVKYIRNRKCIF